MAYKYGDRKQITFLPQCIDDYVKEDAPVRAYDAFVDALDFKELGIDLDPNKVGNSQYDPKTMLKLLVYSYSYGVHSSRKIEREANYNLSFIWLTGGLKPDHKTIAEFRRHNTEVLKKVLKQTVRICIHLDLIDGNILFVDGSKFRANASKAKAHAKDWYIKQLAKVDQRIDELLEECERVDQDEADQASYVKLGEELSQSRQLRERITQAMEKIETSNRTKMNTTDSDSSIMRSRQGSHACYNVQSVVDDKNGLIVHTEVVSDNNDIEQFSNQIEKANENVSGKCQVACADAGYAAISELEKVDKQGIDVVVPSKRQALHKQPGPFDKSEFKYDQKRDCYYCPAGHCLKHVSTDKKRGKKAYQIINKELCRQCKHYGECTSAKSGRRVNRYTNEDQREKFERRYVNRLHIYERRKMTVEHPFGHIKKNLGFNAFSLRGLKKVQGEVSLLSTCFNLTRMINIVGTQRLIAGLQAYRA